MPVEERLAFGERRQVIGVDQGAYCDRPQVGDDEVITRLERLGGRGIERECKARSIPEETEKNQLRRASK